jgi:hypothetical protein
MSHSTWDDYGCVSDDPLYDNGPALSSIFTARHDVAPVGRPCAYYVRPTPITVLVDFGGVIGGAGSAPYALADSQYVRHPKKVTRIIWQGEPGSSVLKIHGLSLRLQNLTVQGCPLEKWNSPHTGSIGFDIEWLDRPDQRNNANGILFDNVSVLACGVAWRTGPLEWPGNKGGHGDNITLRDCKADRCDVAYQTRLDQSVHHILDGFTVRGSGKVIIDAHRGGCVTARHLYFGERWDALLRLGKPTINNNYYDLEVFVDGSARDVRLVEETSADSPAIVKIRGFIAHGATLSEKPVVQLCANSQIEVNMRSSNPANRVRWPR